jgi:hypothetical protein
MIFYKDYSFHPYPLTNMAATEEKIFLKLANQKQELPVVAMLI